MADYKVSVDVDVNSSELDKLEARVKSLEKNNNIKVAVELDDSKLNSSLTSKLKSQTVSVKADGIGVQKTIGSIQTALKNAAKSGQIKLNFDDNGAIKCINNIQKTIKDGEVVKLRVDGVDAVGNAFSAVQKLNAETDSPIEIKVNTEQLGQTKALFQQTEADYKELVGVLKDINQTKIQLTGLDESSKKAKFLNSELERLESRANAIADRSLDSFTDKQLNGLNSVDKKLVSNLGKAQAASIDRSNIASATEEYKRLISTMKEIGSIRVQLQGLDEGSARAETLTKRLKNLKVEAKDIFNANTFSSSQMSGINNLTKNMDNALRDAKDKIIDVKAEIANGITKEYNAGDFSAQISTINRQMAELGSGRSRVLEPYSRLMSAHKELATAIKSQDVNAITAAEEKRAAALNKVNNVLKIQKDVQKEVLAAEKKSIAADKLRLRSDGLSARMDLWLKENSAAAGKFSSQIDKYS